MAGFFAFIRTVQKLHIFYDLNSPLALIQLLNNSKSEDKLSKCERVPHRVGQHGEEEERECRGDSLATCETGSG